jgi:hypothetical protein
MAGRREEFGPYTFEAPDAWPRHTLLLLAGPSDDPSDPPTIRLTRDPRPANEDLRAFAWRRMFELVQRHPDRELVGRLEDPVAGRPALLARFRWEGEAGPAEQVIAWIDAGDGSVLVATIVCGADEQASIQTFQRVLASMRFRAPSASRVEAPPWAT